MTTVASNVVALESEHVLQVYKRNPVVFERGRGCHLYDAQGRGYLDFISGVGVSCARSRQSASGAPPSPNRRRR